MLKTGVLKQTPMCCTAPDPASTQAHCIHPPTHPGCCQWGGVCRSEHVVFGLVHAAPLGDGKVAPQQEHHAPPPR